MTASNESSATIAKPSVTSKEDFDKLMTSAQGPVLVDFMMPGCGACDESQPEFEQLAKDCNGTPSTVARIDVTSEWGAQLADKLKVEGTPTALFAKSAADFDNGKVTEVTDLTSNAARRMLKCAR